MDPWELVIGEDRSYEIRNASGDKVDSMVNYHMKSVTKLPSAGSFGIGLCIVAGVVFVCAGLGLLARFRSFNV